jgi:uncharacterized protein (DUF2252 family)
MPPNGDTGLVSIDDMMAAGKVLRDTVSRAAPADWKKRKGRIDPIAILRSGDAGRLRALVPIRYGRMLQSPFAFYRGSAAVMAADLATLPVSGITVQLCGDCHLMNFGGFATPERNVLFDINDFDETTPGPWEWDVARLVASFILAARSNGLSDAAGREAARVAVSSYREAMHDFTELSPLDTWYARVTAEDLMSWVPKTHRAAIEKRLSKAKSRAGSDIEFPKLAGMVGGHVGIRDTPPLIFHPEVTRAPEFRAELHQVFAAYRESLPEERRELLDQYRVIDAAIKVVGIGSVGRRCWIALLMSAKNDALFLQFKEAVASVLEPYVGKSAYAHHGQRVVMGQRHMQPATDVFLGWVTGPGEKRHFYVRQLNDAKIKPLVDTFDAELLSLYAEACGHVLARAHAKLGDQYTLSGYLGTNDQFDKAMVRFAVAYADKVERDHAALKTAVKNGKIEAHVEA